MCLNPRNSRPVLWDVLCREHDMRWHGRVLPIRTKMLRQPRPLCPGSWLHLWNRCGRLQHQWGRLSFCFQIPALWKVRHAATQVSSHSAFLLLLLFFPFPLTPPPPHPFFPLVGGVRGCCSCLIVCFFVFVFWVLFLLLFIVALSSSSLWSLSAEFLRFYS